MNMMLHQGEGQSEAQPSGNKWIFLAANVTFALDMKEMHSGCLPCFKLLKLNTELWKIIDGKPE